MGTIHEENIDPRFDERRGALERFIATRGIKSALRLPGVIEKAAKEIFAFSPFCPVQNFTGQPSMNVPLHWSGAGLPIGTMFTGRFGDEQTLFQLARQLEQARPWAQRRAPVFAS